MANEEKTEKNKEEAADDSPSSERDRWNERYRQADPRERDVSALLARSSEMLPSSGSALDIAGGDGIEALWLARRGLSTTLADVSDVALSQATDRATAAGVELHTIALDLETEPLPTGSEADGRWTVIYLAHYLNRVVLAEVADLVADTLVIAIATVRNLERNERPSARFLLDEGELQAAAGNLDIVRYDEDWRPNGNHEAWLIARRG